MTAVTNKETMAMPGVKLETVYRQQGFDGQGQPIYASAIETMRVYGQLGMALRDEINANHLEDQILGRNLTQAEVTALLASSDGVLNLDGADRDLSEVRTLRLKADSYLEKGVAAQIAGE